MKRLVLLKTENVYKLLSYDKIDGLIIYESKHDISKMTDIEIANLQSVKYNDDERSFINEIVTVSKTQLYNLIGVRGTMGVLADHKLAIIRINKIEDYKLEDDIISISFNLLTPTIPEIVSRDILYLEKNKSFWFVINNTLIAFNNIRGSVIKEYTNG